MRKATLILILISSLLFSTIAEAFLLSSAHAQSPLDILIDTDGSIKPSTSLIISSGNIYYFTDKINGQIEIRLKSNIILDGNGYTLQGPGGMGIWLNHVHNVTITNLTIQGFFQSGLYLTASCNNTIYNNNLNSNDYCGIELENASNNNNIFGNNITSNNFAGIRLSNNSPNPSVGVGSDFNNMYYNNLSSNHYYGIFITNSSYNTIYCNDIVNNSYVGIGLVSSSNNQFYLNRVINNSLNAQVGGFVPAWIDSYPGVGGLGTNTWDNGSIGNYWSDYALKYPNASEIDASGIGNFPYIIDANNTDRYPLIAPSGVSATSPTSPEIERENTSIPMAIIAGVIGVSVTIVSISLFYYFKKHHR